MAFNALTRDQILIQALDLAAVPDLNRHDRPSGTIVTGAYCVDWLETVLHTFYSLFPWAGTVAHSIGLIAAGVNTYSIGSAFSNASGFMLDVKDGVLINVGGQWRRMRRRPLQNAIDLGYNQNPGPPVLYTFQGNNVLVAPLPDKAYNVDMWFYNRPAALAPTEVPIFPSDLILVTYIRILALEWIRALPIGSAQQYTEARIADLIKAGLGNEPERAEIPLNEDQFLPGAGSSDYANTDWLVTR